MYNTMFYDPMFYELTWSCWFIKYTPFLYENMLYLLVRNVLLHITLKVIFLQNLVFHKSSSKASHQGMPKRLVGLLAFLTFLLSLLWCLGENKSTRISLSDINLADFENNSGTISMPQCKTMVSPLLIHWRYHSLAVSHGYDLWAHTCS